MQGHKVARAQGLQGQVQGVKRYKSVRFARGKGDARAGAGGEGCDGSV